MVDFQKAISVATENAKALIQNASNFSLEGVVISDDDKLYEVSLSYSIEGRNPLSIDDQANSGLYQLAKLMRYRRECKVFLIDKRSGEFRGFKNSR